MHKLFLAYKKLISFLFSLSLSKKSYMNHLTIFSLVKDQSFRYITLHEFPD